MGNIKKYFLYYSQFSFLSNVFREWRLRFELALKRDNFLYLYICLSFSSTGSQATESCVVTCVDCSIVNWFDSARKKSTAAKTSKTQLVIRTIYLKAVGYSSLNSIIKNKKIQFMCAALNCDNCFFFSCKALAANPHTSRSSVSRFDWERRSEETEFRLCRVSSATSF